MSSISDKSASEPSVQQTKTGTSENWRTFFRLPRNVYLLLFFTLGKGFQLSIANLTLGLYVNSLGYKPDFIGLFSAMPALGALLGAVPTGILADKIGRKPVLLMTALLSPLFLALTATASSAPLLLALNFVQGFVSTAYWVTNLPLLTDSTTERQRVGVLALNSFLLLGVGSLGNLLGGAIPEYMGTLLHISAGSTVPLRVGVFVAGAFTLVFGLPLWFLHERKGMAVEPEIAPGGEVDLEKASGANGVVTVEADVRQVRSKRDDIVLFTQLLVPDFLFTMGEGAVVALIQVYFVLQFSLMPGTLGVIFTLSGLMGGIFSLTAPLFVKRWGKLKIITTVQYASAPLMVLIGFAPTLPLAVGGEYARSFLRTLVEPVYAAFAMEQVTPRQRSTLAGFYSVTWSLGFSIGPMIAGWLQTNVSLAMSFVFGGVCLVLAASTLLLSFGRRKASI